MRFGWRWRRKGREQERSASEKRFGEGGGTLRFSARTECGIFSLKVGAEGRGAAPPKRPLQLKGVHSARGSGIIGS